MAAQDFPDGAQIADDSGVITTAWRMWFQRVQNVVIAAYSSGPTANRPTSLLWIGRQFYDTTLGKPVWVHSVKPTVWHDATGAAV